MQTLQGYTAMRTPKTPTVSVVAPVTSSWRLVARFVGIENQFDYHFEHDGK
jgi:hypothetical protein